MQNLQKNNLPLDVALFEVEELEERLEACWQGEEWQNHGYTDNSGVHHDNWVKVPCGTPEYVEPIPGG